MGHQATEGQSGKLGHCRARLATVMVDRMLSQRSPHLRSRPALVHRGADLVSRGLGVGADEGGQLLHIRAGGHLAAGGGCERVGWAWASRRGEAEQALTVAAAASWAVLPCLSSTHVTPPIRCAAQCLQHNRCQNSLYSVGLEGQSHSRLSGSHSCGNRESGGAQGEHSGGARWWCTERAALTQAAVHAG